MELVKINMICAQSPEATFRCSNQVAPPETPRKYLSCEKHLMSPALDRRGCAMEGAKNPRAEHSSDDARQRAFWPFDGCSQQLQSDTKASVRQAPTINYAGHRLEISTERSDHQLFIQIHGSFGQNAYTQRAHVFGSRSHRRGRVQEAGNLYGDRQSNPFLKSSRPQRHL